MQAYTISNAWHQTVFKHLDFNMSKLLIVTFWMIPKSDTLYGCETWSLTVRETQGLRVRTRRRAEYLNLKMEGVTGDWRK
jgi:hypothetical protein